MITSLSMNDWIEKVDIVERINDGCGIVDVHIDRSLQEVLLNWFEDNELVPEEWHWHQPTLEDVFLSAVGIPMYMSLFVCFYLPLVFILFLPATGTHTCFCLFFT